MNLLLFYPHEIEGEYATLSSPKRIVHIQDVLKQQLGQALRCGVVNGKIGEGVLIESTPCQMVFKLQLTQEPPVPFPLALIVAMSRPKTMLKVIQFSVTLGVKQLHIINAAKVDKGFWQSPVFEATSLQEECLLALEQAKDTVMPEIHFHPLFRPFIEDYFPTISALYEEKIVFHPYQAESLNSCNARCGIIAIGPEGGWVDFELAMFQQAGFKNYLLCDRILRVEQAVAYALGRLS